MEPKVNEASSLEFSFQCITMDIVFSCGCRSWAGEKRGVNY